MEKQTDFSVIVPLWNEDESLRPLHEWIQRVMKENVFDYEIIFVNDGSTDASWKVIEELHKENPDTVHGICSVATMARARPYSVASRQQRVRW